MHCLLWAALILAPISSAPSSTAGDPPTVRQRAEPDAAPEQTDSRAERWRLRRWEKSRHLRPDLLSGVERGFLWLEQTNFLEINYRGFYPRYSSLGPGAGSAPGVRYWKPDLRGSKLDFQSSAAISTRGYQEYDLQFGRIILTGPPPFLEPSGNVGISQYGDSAPGGERFFVYGDVTYRSLPQEDFYGIGPDSRETDRTDYKLRDSTLDLVAGVEFNRTFSAAVRVGLLDVNTSPGTDERFPATQEAFSEETAPGITRQGDYVRLNTAFFVDFRDRLRNPHRGGILSFSFSRYDERTGGALDFNRFAFDARHYQPLGSVQRVLALHFFTSVDDADRNASVPFYLQNTLGGSETLRGFRHFRFRDVNILYLSAEYRWEAAPALEFALFYDAGKVFSDRSEFDLTGLRKSWGFGVRLKTTRAVVLRLDAGWSEEGPRTYLSFGPSF